MTDSKSIGPGKHAGTKEKVKAAADTAANQVKSGAQNVADTATTEAAKYADQAKGAAADEVKGVASALRTAADEMRSGSPQERTFSQLADSLADASETMQDKDLGEIVGAVTQFAKRNPAVFLGTAALVGFAATRFAKASDGSKPGLSDDSYRSRQMVQPSETIRSKTTSTSTVQSPAVAGTQKGSQA